MKHNLDLATDLQKLSDTDVVPRIWRKDHTLWSADPDEISNRLGWLDLVTRPLETDLPVEDLVSHLEASSLTDVVLIGMGGSSLGAEALRASFREFTKSPIRLHVLDSTHPDWVATVLDSIRPERTLVLVASKSGTTAEIKALFDIFWQQFGLVLSASDLGQHFVAITDPDSPLSRLADDQGFHSILLNPADIGGRFSVLSRFGMVAARTIGIDTAALLEQAALTAHKCRNTSLEQNPGVMLGTALGSAANRGRDQLTLLTSPSISTFGLWVEQLIAESTGKDGLGILPVVGESTAFPSERRVFVVLRFSGDDDNRALDRQVAELRDRRVPLVELGIDEISELAGELFRWQFATAVAAHLIGVHPFDQPDVQATKKVTSEALQRFSEVGALPDVDASDDLVGALRDQACTYLAVLAFSGPDPELEAAIASLRDALSRATLPHQSTNGLSTTFGYGPRFLHSTGQLHKGGPAGAIFLQILVEPERDYELPGRDYSLALLLRAQADGDLSALQSKQRRCIRVHGSKSEITAILRGICEEISKFDQAPACP